MYKIFIIIWNHSPILSIFVFTYLIFNLICICIDFKFYLLKGFIPIWLRGNYNACYSTTSNVTDAVSPAFIIPGT